MQTQLWAIGLVVISGLIGGFGPIYLKKGAKSVNFSRLSTFYKNPFLIIGILVYAVSTIIFIPALKGGELSVLYPFGGLIFVWVLIYSRILLKEKMNPLKWLGIIVILAGVSLMGFGA